MWIVGIQPYVEILLSSVKALFKNLNCSSVNSKTPTVSSIDFLKHPGGSLIKVTLFLPQKRIEFSG
jgi:hypothetical protein